MEQQQHHLTCGLRELYKLTLKGETWTGPPLELAEHGQLLLQDILERLGVIQSSQPDSRKSDEMNQVPTLSDSSSPPLQITAQCRQATQLIGYLTHQKGHRIQNHLP
jgi:hypothetical protein